MSTIEDSWVEVGRVLQKVNLNTDKCEMSLRDSKFIWMK